MAGSNSEGDGALSIVLSRKWQNTAQTTDLVSDLVAAGADPSLRNDGGVTPMPVDRATTAG